MECRLAGSFVSVQVQIEAVCCFLPAHVVALPDLTFPLQARLYVPGTAAHPNPVSCLLSLVFSSVFSPVSPSGVADSREALDTFDPGDACTVFTPDDTHFDIAMEAVKRGMHAIVTKPVVKTLKEHRLLHEAAKEAGVLVMVEVHKRFDPIYVDARDRIRDLGGMSYMYSYMSQPKVCARARVFAVTISALSYAMSCLFVFAANHTSVKYCSQAL